MKTEGFRLLRLIAAWAIAGYIAVEVLLTFPQVIPDTQSLLYNDNATYDDKMHAKWTGYYDLMQLIVQETPENAAILMDNTARPQIDLYFLYPRRLFYGGQKDFESHPEIGYLVVSNVFPDFPVNCDKHMIAENVGLCRVLR